MQRLAMVILRTEAKFASNSASLFVKCIFLCTFALLISSSIAINYDDYGHGRVTYYGLGLATESNDLIQTNFPFMLEYFGLTSDSSASPYWEIPVTCAMSSGYTATDNPLKITCGQSGEHRFTVYKNGDDTTADSWYIYIPDMQTKYDWMAADSALTGLVVPTESSNRTLNIWIIDSQDCDADELTGAALAPSATSKRITAGLRSIGVEPFIGIATDATIDILTDTTWNSDLGAWQLTYQAEFPTINKIRLSTNGASFLGADIRSVSHMITATDLPKEPSAFTEDVTGVIAGWTSGWQLNPCAVNPSVQIARPTGTFTRFRFTLVNFREASKLYYIEQGALDGTADTTAVSLLEIMPTTTSILALTASGSVYYTEGSTWSAATGLTSAVSSIVAPAAYDPLRDEDNNISAQNKVYAAYSATDGFFLSTDNGATWSALAVDLGAHTTALSFIVSSVEAKTLNILASDGSTIHTFVHTVDAVGDETTVDNGAVEDIDSIAPWTFPSPYIMGFGTTAKVSPNMGISWTELDFVSRDPARPAAGLDAGETISRVSGRGSFAVIQTSTNRVFIFLLGSMTATELSAGIAVDGAGLISPAPWSQAVYTMQAQFGGVGYRTLAVNELISTKAPLYVETTGANVQNAMETCSYDSFTWSYEPIIYLDRFDTASLALAESDSLLVTQSESEWLNVTISGSTATLEQLESTVNLTSDDDWLRSMHSISLTLGTPDLVVPCIWKSASVSESVMSVFSSIYEVYVETVLDHVKTSAMLSAAADPLHPTTRVKLGCPPNRHLRVKEVSFDPSDCAIFATGDRTDFSQEFSLWEYLRPGPAVASSYAADGFDSYDVTAYGCPISVYQGTSGWKPTLQLYDGPTYVKDVEADYVIYELRGRTDFTYNATEGDVGCTHGAQSWGYMTDGCAKDRWECWTKTNYIPCTEDTGRSYGSSDVYDVLNNAGDNAIVFTADGADGVFLFRARVLDPEFSFCELTVDFAVDTYGAPLSVLVTVLVVVLGVALACCGVCCTYSLFQYKRFKAYRKKNA
ncbi:Cation channel sperm-associated protein subunit delta/epsilon [Carpediemonas membranifera]|uniref:Cation channel sperm-associated protein subunit delta/epsilon n=1 Tax=Carpediemonas membranifera TaxID=201153 RepID=A0A8J6AQB6_9EUKA|nr:Cation channel sperm-associated protein subunit delta/epsilon [Carpediemonas membranifera]|eukprot:KAG9390823.1 Cation channel sperm-associated protein subunit delta/epsilon [Carpediemonas membranifera]